MVELLRCAKSRWRLPVRFHMPANSLHVTAKKRVPGIPCATLAFHRGGFSLLRRRGGFNYKREVSPNFLLVVETPSAAPWRYQVVELS